MAKKRIHEIAKQQGLSTQELITRLREAGIEGKLAVSTIEEQVALDALHNGQAPAREQPADGAVPAAEPNGKPAASPGEPADPAESGQGRDGRRLSPLFWLKTVFLVLVKGEEKSGSGTPVRVERHPPVRTRPATNRAERLPLQLPVPAERRPAAIAIAVAAVAVVLALGGWLLGAFDGGGRQRVAEAPKPRPLTAIEREDLALRPFRSIVAAVRVRSVGIYRSPRRLRTYMRLSNPNADGAPLVFLVKAKTPNWLQVYLPSRPNGSIGWIRRSHVALYGHNYSVKISLGRHELTAWNGAGVIMREPIGVGRAVTPTPSGLYYITELLQQPEPDGPYGPYAFGLSVHSNILTEFEGADGILGLHGTNDPAAIGTDVSHGCIRMNNDAITRLAHVLPAGTPVRITRS